ncbi:MAG: hypothetical protein MUF54_03165, partial [Polyangiaceae bacterium]|nr:hypothetical protein [Polyangiaceae bacterium]
SSGDLAARCLLVPRSNNREILFIRTRPDFDSLGYVGRPGAVSNQPSRAWMTQIARNLTDCLDGFLRDTR